MHITIYFLVICLSSICLLVHAILVVCFNYRINVVITSEVTLLVFLTSLLSNSNHILHGSVSVLKAMKQVNGKGQNSNPRHT